jgi:hypothetical protein
VPPELSAKILEILARHNNMTIATLRPDGFPQATTVGFANDGMHIYFGCGPNSQKARNLARDPRVSAAIDEDHADWNDIDGISLAGTAERVTDHAELEKLGACFSPSSLSSAPSRERTPSIWSSFASRRVSSRSSTTPRALVTATWSPSRAACRSGWRTRVAPPPPASASCPRAAARSDARRRHCRQSSADRRAPRRDLPGPPSAWRAAP